MSTYKEMIDEQEANIRAISDEITAIKMKLDLVQNCMKKCMQSKHNIFATPRVSGTATKCHHGNDETNSTASAGCQSQCHIFSDNNDN